MWGYLEKVVFELWVPNVFLSNLEEMVFESILKSSTSLKVLVFSWRLLLYRLPTKSNLIRRNVLLSNDNINCILCRVYNLSHIHHLCLRTKPQYC